jgi:hypothetical protein
MPPLIRSEDNELTTTIMTKKTLRNDGPEPDYLELPLIISVAEARKILGPRFASWPDADIAKLVVQLDQFAAAAVRGFRVPPSN